MASIIELISRPKDGQSMRSTYCVDGESLSARPSTLYEIKLDGQEISTETKISREGGELHLVFSSRATFDVTDWDKAHGSELILSSRVQTYEELTKRFIAAYSIEGVTFSIRSNTQLFLGRLGSTHTLNFKALESILDRLRLQDPLGKRHCLEHGRILQTLGEPPATSASAIFLPNSSNTKRATRCVCSFQRRLGGTDLK
jgi:hypothetical protein